jgi:hypothetical protein
VRDSHLALDGKIFAASDPIWDVIYPPNGWNCRCYITPLDIDEVRAEKKENRIDITDDKMRKALIKEANIHKDFARNSGKVESIWGKWLQSKLTGKNFDEITDRMKEFANKMPDAEDVINKIQLKAVPFRKLEFTKENSEKDFPENTVLTPLGEFSFANDFFDKLSRKRREDLLGLIKPTMAHPEYIIVDKDYGTLFLKGFIREGINTYAGIIRSKDGLIISLHEKGNVLNKIKSGKILIYQSETSTTRGAGSPDSFVDLPDVSSRLKLNMQKIEESINTNNQFWGEYITSVQNV